MKRNVVRPYRYLSMLIPALLAALLLCLFPAPTEAAVTHFIRADYRGVLYEYSYEDLLDSYILSIMGDDVALFDDYVNKRPIALKDDKSGYVNYEDVLDAYILSIFEEKPFDMNTYTSSSNAMTYVMPPTVLSVHIDDAGKLKNEETLLLSPPEEEAPAEDPGDPVDPDDPPVDVKLAVTAITADKTEAQQILTSINWAATTEGGEELRYAWYVYKDGELVSCTWYTDNNNQSYVPTQAGNYRMRVWAIDPDDRYHNQYSADITITSPIKIVDPKLTWSDDQLGLINEPIVKLVQHHMAHPTWTIYEVHNYHRTRTYVQDDGEIGLWAGIGYNYWIGFDGTIYEGRGRNKGGHAGKAWNNKTLGIGYQGHFDEQNMTPEQLISGTWLNAILIVEDNLSVDDIVGHAAVSATSCPGKNFRMNDLKAEVLKLLPDAYK